MRIRRKVAGQDVMLNVLPRFNDAALRAWDRFCKSDKVFGLDVESTAIEGLGAFDRTMKMRLIQFGNYTEAWALDPTDPNWRPLIVALLLDETKRFVSHNAAFDTTRVEYEFDILLGDRSLDTLPMAALCWPGKTARKGLKPLSDVWIDSGLSESSTELHAHFIDMFMAQKPRKTALLPKSFVAGVSDCRRPGCHEPSWSGSLCGYCRACYLKRKSTAEIETWGWRNIDLHDEIYLAYAGLDAIYVRRLLDILAAQVGKRGMNRLSKTEQRVKRQMTGASKRGMRVDLEWTTPILQETEQEYDAAASVIESLTGLPPGSNYMHDWLRDRGLKVKSLDKDHLPALIEKYGEREDVGPVLDGLATVSRVSNLLTNLRTIYRHATEGDGFVHANINTLQAHTGRMSATSPAVQTLAKAGDKGTKLRGCFVARDGYSLVGADYDSQEIRLGAALSKDEMLLRIVHEGLNQHVLTAESIFAGEWVDKKTNPDLYHKAKTLDFAQQYGAFPRKIAATLKISEREATVLWQKWRDTYAGLVRWSEKLARQRYVRNPFGRLIPRDPYRDYANANYMIQSTGRDVLGAALCRLADEGWADYFWLPIHDELVMEVPDNLVEQACEALTRCMSTTVLGVDIPAEGELIGKRWAGLGQAPSQPQPREKDEECFAMGALVNRQMFGMV